MLSAPNAPPGAAGIERALRQGHAGVAHRTGRRPHDVRLVVEQRDCGRRSGTAVNHWDYTLKGGDRGLERGATIPFAHGRNAALLVMRVLSRAALASPAACLRWSDSRRGASIASNLMASRIAFRASALNRFEIRIS